jgi:cytochrome P450
MLPEITIFNALSLGALFLVLNTLRKLVRLYYLPPHLRNYPRVPVLRTLTNVKNGVPYEQAWREEFRDRYKDSKYVVAHALCGWELNVGDVEAAKYITTNFDLFHHVGFAHWGIENCLTDRFVGQGIVSSDGEVWYRQRPVINQAFSRLKPTSAAGEAALHMIDNLKKTVGTTVDLNPHMRRAMFRSLLNAIFDLPELLVNDRDKEISDLIGRIFRAATHPFYLMFGFLDRPWNPYRRPSWDMLAELDTLIYSIIKKKQEELMAKGDEYDPSEDRDLITLLLNSNRDPENLTMHDLEIVDNVKTLFLAGHETTASGLTFCMQLLAIHPEVQEKAREEVFRVLKCKPGDAVTPTPQQQSELVYLNAVVRESNRLFAPSSRLTSRYAVQDVTLPDGTFLPKNTYLTIDQWAILRSDKIWQDPEAFRPERHLDNREGRTPNEYIVFSAGKRICPGMNLANIEQRVMLALCVQMFSWELANPADKHISTGAHWVVQPANALVRIHLLS